ncbi:unnamed protein product [Mytilus edulis]|uniref:Uncharacterized protein n=1 Tax=Mytilus edulis TaxID=6550 RepID=A0A8S3T2A5_MYTED|nr:unnamed protein product [Mytilus edulis]
MKELSSRKDIRGQTPWTLMIGNTGEYADFRNILDYAVSPEVIDNLGNTVLQQTCGNSNSHSHLEFLEYMIKSGADINAQNIYGETILSMTVDEKILKIFFEFNPDFSVKDRWGRCALLNLLKYSITDLLETLLVEVKVDVNTSDIYGSTPLHFAAYHNYEKQIEILLKYDADVNARDKLQERPLDTAKRHKSFHCTASLKTVDRTKQGYTLIYTRIPTFEEILCEFQEIIVISSRIRSPQNIQTLLQLPLNLKRLHVLSSRIVSN